MNEAKYRENIEDNLLFGTGRLSLGLMFTFRQQKNSKHAARTIINGYRTNLSNC